MWWLAISIGIEILNSVLKEEEREARSQWECKREEINRKVEEHNEFIQGYLSGKNQDYNYHKLIYLHHSSVLAADEAYKLLNDAHISLDAIGKMLVTAKDRRLFIECQLRKTRIQSKKKELDNELKQIQELRKNLFEDKNNVKAQKEELFIKLKHLNKQTGDVKIMIRDHCGTAGKSWYQRSQERKASHLTHTIN